MSMGCRLAWSGVVQPPLHSPLRAIVALPRYCATATIQLQLRGANRLLPAGSTPLMPGTCWLPADRCAYCNLSQASCRFGASAVERVACLTAPPLSVSGAIAVPRLSHAGGLRASYWCSGLGPAHMSSYPAGGAPVHCSLERPVSPSLYSLRRFHSAFVFLAGSCDRRQLMSTKARVTKKKQR